MTNCIIIDDEPFARNLLEDYISKVPFLELKGSFASALQALESLNKERIDLLFLDIQMPDINGITFLKSLRHKPKVIFTTAYAEFALEGFELDALDYLLKPFDFPRFLKAVEKYSSNNKSPLTQNNHNDEPIKYIFVKDGSSIVKIALTEILYIKGVKDYVQIITPSRKVMSLQTLKELSLNLPEHSFSRMHNSYIVGLHYIDSINHNEIQIGKISLPIGQTYKKSFMESLLRIGISK